MVNRIKITKLKLLIAKILYFLVKIFFWNDMQIRTIGNIKYELDLREGIDLHLFIFGSFQKHIYDNALIKFDDNAVVFDVGANYGIMSLKFAEKLKNGIVYSFEPTDYALKKFNKNLDLNLKLKEKIIVHQAFVSSENKRSTQLPAYSSWPVVGNLEKHSIHGGVLQHTENIPSVTIDSFCEINGINKINLIKIDTDGHELNVLKGSELSINKFRPMIIFEIGIYIMKERGVVFKDYSEFFRQLDYKIITSKRKIPITISNYSKHIPEFGTIDLIALPNEIS